MKSYQINLTIDGIEKLQNKIEKIKSLNADEKFIEYLENKCFETLQKVTKQRLNSDDEDLYYHTYRNNHQHKHSGNEITLWNETLIDLDKLNLSEETRSRYSEGLSLAKIVEFGTGIVGSTSEAAKYAEDWEYMANPNRDYSKAWVYKDSNGQLHFTKGIEGRLIFYNTKKEIENNYIDWIINYVDSQLGGQL